MSKVTDAQIAAIKALFETGDKLTEDNFADLINAIQEAAQEHEHVSGGGAGSGAGNAAPIQDATETDKGIVELATVAEAQAGTDTTRAVTAAGLLVRKVDTAIIGGDMTGNARGANALDIQSTRSHVVQVASGIQATALGLHNKASGNYAIAVGYKNTASHYYSQAIGRHNTADGDYSHAIGAYNTSSAYYSNAIGHMNTATNQFSTAVGSINTASGLCATAVGHVSTASGDYSIAIGHKATASGNYSTAAGRYSTASDYSSLALGSGNTASGYYAIAVGIANTASGQYSAALGLYNYAFDDYSMAIGYMTCAFAEKSLALGYGAKSGVPTTTNICGPQIIRKDRGENADYTFYSYCGVEVVLTSKEIDLTTVADQTLTLPAGCKFWLDEIGIIATQIDGLTTQPTIRFGITGDLAKHHTAAITTKLTAAGKREKFDPLVPEDGEVSLTGGVTSAAAGTTVKGRFYWKGMLIENE